MLQKQNFIKCIFLVFTFSLFYLDGDSQSLIKLVLNEDKIHQHGTLISDNQVKGYYQMYEVEEISKGISTFKLEIFDPNLNYVGTDEFSHSNTANKFHIFYIGDYIITKNYHTGDKLVIINKYDLSLNLIESKKVVDKLLVFTQYYFMPMPNNGMLELNPGEVGKVMYEFIKTKFHKDNEVIWENKYEMPFNVAGGAFEMDGDFIFKKDKRFVLGKTDYNIYGMDIKTGETFANKINFNSDKIFTTPILDKYYSEEELFIYGDYFIMKKKKPEGIYLSLVDKKGLVNEMAYVSYEDDIFSEFPEIEKTKDTFFALDKIIGTKNNEYFIIGQVYDYRKRQIGNEYKYRDVIISKLNADFDVEYIKKYQNSIPIRKFIKSSNSFNSALLFQEPKIGGFNLLFTQTNNDNSEFIIVIKDPIMTNKKEYVTEIIYRSYVNGEWSEDRIKPKYNNITNVSPAKFGYLFIEEYNKSGKTYETRLEKLNF